MEIISYINIKIKVTKVTNSALVLYSPACKEKKHICFFSIIFKKEFKSGAEFVTFVTFNPTLHQYLKEQNSIFKTENQTIFTSYYFIAFLFLDLLDIFE